MTDDSIDNAVLARYLRADCTDQERRAVERWAAESLDHRRLLDTLRQVWDTDAGAPPSPEAGPMWASLRRRLAEERAPIRLVPPVAREDTWRRRLPALATAAGLVLAAGTGAWMATQHTVVAAPVPMREVATSKGQRAELRLGDSTRVVLGVQSKLRFPATTGPRAREVELEGTAYFTVTHDPLHPFRVRAGGTTTEDLGTAFVVRAYQGDTAVRVVVESGTVAVRRSGAAAPAVTLTRGELATIGTSGTPVIARNVELGDYVGWTTGRLQFRRTPLGDVVRELERWYDIDITVADPRLYQHQFTATFEDQSLSEVLQVLAVVLNVRVEQHGRAVILHPRAPAPPRP